MEEGLSDDHISEAEAVVWLRHLKRRMAALQRRLDEICEPPPGDGETSAESSPGTAHRFS